MSSLIFFIEQYLNRMQTASRSRNSSKSYKSTSPSYRLSSRHSQTHIPSHTSIPQLITSSNDFFSNNQQTIGKLLKILKQQENIIAQHKQWHRKVLSKITSDFQFSKSAVNNILQQQQNSFKNTMEKEYICFIDMFSYIKEGIRNLYKQKIELEKHIGLQKNITAKYMKLQRIQDYYGSPFGQNTKMVNQMQRENQQRQDFRSLNHFYSQNRTVVDKLNRQAVQLLSFPQRLCQREEQMQGDLKRFVKEVQLCFVKNKDREEKQYH